MDGVFSKSGDRLLGGDAPRLDHLVVRPRHDARSNKPFQEPVSDKTHPSLNFIVIATPLLPQGVTNSRGIRHNILGSTDGIAFGKAI